MADTTQREARRQARMQRGQARAAGKRQPSRAELEEGAHLLHCDRRHGRGARCNAKLLPAPVDS